MTSTTDTPLSPGLEPLRWFLTTPPANLHSLTEDQALSVIDYVNGCRDDLTIEDVKALLMLVAQYTAMDLPSSDLVGERNRAVGTLLRFLKVLTAQKFKKLEGLPTE